MVSRNSSILIFFFLVLLIVFDASQQKFYIDTFNLSTEPLSLKSLLGIHLMRWLAWLIMSLPFGYFAWKEIQLNLLVPFHSKIKIFVAIIGSSLVAVLFISFYTIYLQNLEFSSGSLRELFVFFCFQKGLIFFMAYLTMVFLLVSFEKSRLIEAHEIEIVNLREVAKTQNEKGTQSSKDLEPHLNIKTGHKLKSIPLSSIAWIQADDYCVRIHTDERSYTLRKSLKSLEQELKPFRFIRVHRGALLNMQYIDQVNFDSATIKLQNDFELPLSKSGIRTLKQRIEETSLN